MHKSLLKSKLSKRITYSTLLAFLLNRFFIFEKGLIQQKDRTTTPTYFEIRTLSSSQSPSTEIMKLNTTGILQELKKISKNLESAKRELTMAKDEAANAQKEATLYKDKLVAFMEESNRVRKNYFSAIATYFGKLAEV